MINNTYKIIQYFNILNNKFLSWTIRFCIESRRNEKHSIDQKLQCDFPDMIKCFIKSVTKNNLLEFSQMLHEKQLRFYNNDTGMWITL